jgi:Kdo2-lipid IVA lauroyltransferase/acyltransferase
MEYSVYLIFRIFVIVFQFIPFRVLYCFSDLLFLVFYYLVGYRKKVVFTNLRNSFPRKTEQEIAGIARKFYHHLTDILIESLKAFTMSEEAVVRRYTFGNRNIPDELYKRGRSVIVVAGHYGNWEWPGIAAGMQMMHKPIGFYKPLSNRFIDRYVRKTRVKGRARLASIANTAETFLTDWGEPAAYYMVADQSPSSVRLALWTKFLNQDTAFLHGPEKYARLHNLPVVYAQIKKVRRGRYLADFILLEENTGGTRVGEITEKFKELLEKQILETPENYLWSHRRWKHKR